MKFPILAPALRHTIVTAVAVALIAAADPARATLPVPAFRSAPVTAPARPAPAPASGSTSLNTFQRANLERMAHGQRALAVDDTLRLLVFQVEFQDSLMGGTPGSNRPELRDSTWFANELIHMRQYFTAASRDRMHLAWNIDNQLIRLPRTMSYYGSDANEEKRVVELIETVVGLRDAAYDYTQYDHVFVIHAGAGQETDVAGDSPIQIWSSFYDRSDVARYATGGLGGIVTGDQLGGEPFLIDNFSIVPAHASQDFATVGTLGIWAFEIGSRIGLVPLFDSTPGIPDSQGIGSFCLMAYGLFNANGFVPSLPCEYNRVLAGWVEPVVIDPADGDATVRLADINTGADGDTLCVRVPISESEYYLVANRVHDANFDSLFTFDDTNLNLIPENTESLDGAEFDFFLTDLSNPALDRFDSTYGFDVLFRHTGSGVYVWHVDERVIAQSVQSGFLPDDFVAQKGVDLEEADGVQDLDRPGAAAFALGSHFDSYRAGNGGSVRFGPDTKPASLSNSGTPTGLTIETLSAPGSTMTVAIRRALPFAETRTRWNAASRSQPATAVDLDGAGATELVVLSDDAGVFVLRADGREWVDGDADPATVAPFIAVPGVTWSGPPAFANLDGGADTEIVAVSVDGDVYAWKASGAELADGDSNPATVGILFQAASVNPAQTSAAGPLLVDVVGDAVPEILVTVHDGSGLRAYFVDATGTLTAPGNPAVSAHWPALLNADVAAAPALARVRDGTAETVGLVLTGYDSTAARARINWTPLSVTGALGGPTMPWQDAFAASVIPMAPACGDLDGDGDDEIVVAAGDGTVYVFDIASALTGTATQETGRLRSTSPSAPALGDVDRDGTLEIVLWDDAYMYLLKSNARPMLEFPRVIRPESAGEAPRIVATRGQESALVADLDGNGSVEVVFALDDGTVHALAASGGALGGFPRMGPAGAGAAPTLAELAPGQWSLSLVSSNARVGDIDAIGDSLATVDETAVSIQSLAAAPGTVFWSMARGDVARTGRVATTLPLQASGRAFDPESFMIYPNPVKGDVVHARITTHASVQVNLSVYTVEGQVAVSQSFTVNPNGLIDTPFDEEVDVRSLKSGVYLLRLEINGSGGGSVVKPFAIRR